MIKAIGFSILLGGGLYHLAPGASPPMNTVENALVDGDTDAAVANAQEWTGREPQSASAWHWLGLSLGKRAEDASILTRLRWAGQAREALERARQLDTADAEIQLDLMAFYAQTPAALGGGAQKARAEQVALASRNRLLGRVGAAIIARHVDGDPEAAERHLRGALIDAPTDLRVLRPLNALLLEQKRAADARAMWRSVLDVSPDQPFALYMTGRLCLDMNSDFEQGLAQLDRYIAIGASASDVPEANVHWRRGQLLERLRRPAEAIAALDRAVELQPKLREAAALLARLRKAAP
ncbi:tetratricopeptide repeat protein [Tahibacter amnicola]|uniref:Tetratricopeptide repeat protein n=1 Tax=Tahibacter amnicola TaxID=2976241 RepID=A0ABY6B8H6_9GAMM|nr:tetratricopeptide repeat protein [Tahibacter amnicola]UXI66179.1 tetratricopeptide repeat protein [Tahibacter amnicola]